MDIKFLEIIDKEIDIAEKSYISFQERCKANLNGKFPELREGSWQYTEWKATLRGKYHDLITLKKIRDLYELRTSKTT